MSVINALCLRLWDAKSSVQFITFTNPSKILLCDKLSTVHIYEEGLHTCATNVKSLKKVNNSFGTCFTFPWVISLVILPFVFD